MVVNLRVFLEWSSSTSGKENTEQDCLFLEKIPVLCQTIGPEQISEKRKQVSGCSRVLLLM